MTPPPDVLAELDARQEAVRVAERRVTEAEASERTARRSVDRAMAPLRDYHEQIAAGEREPDEAHERELLAALREAQATVDLRPAYSSPVTGDGIARLIGVDAVDTVAEARLAGARRALEARRAELTTFVAEHLDELAAARVPASMQAGARMAVALEAVDAADREWREESRWWAALGRLAGDRGHALGSLPGNPAGALSQPHERPPAPIPAALLAGLQEVAL